MKLEDEVLLSYYREIEKIDENGNICLVRHVENQKFFVRKIRSASLEKLYLSLQDIHSAGLPEIYHVIRDEENIVVVEEFINGITLSDYLHEHGQLSEDTACRIVLQLCSILENLHKADPPIIHRDIKPSNIIIDALLNVTLIDFDASKNYDKDKCRDTVLMGTADFAAPEQFGFRQSDARTDIYALGVLLNVLLTGKLPSEEKYSGRLSGIISRCTELDQKKRYCNVDALAKHLNIPSTSLVPPGFRSRKPWKIAISVCGYAIIICLCCWMEFEDNNPTWWITANRTAALLLMLAVVALVFDYAGICSRIPVARSRNRLTSWLGRLTWFVLFIIAILLVLTIISPLNH